MPRQVDLAPRCDPEVGCITCGDTALELLVHDVDQARGLALCVDDMGREETVETELVEGVEAGDVLLVHAGTAIARSPA